VAVAVAVLAAALAALAAALAAAALLALLLQWLQLQQRRAPSALCSLPPLQSWLQPVASA
jgi:hypothetical protein